MVDAQNGANIQRLSAFPTENEILLPAATLLEVVGVLDLGGGLKLVQLKEVVNGPMLIE